MGDRVNSVHVLQRSQSVQHGGSNGVSNSNTNESTNVSVEDENRNDRASLEDAECPRTRNYNTTRNNIDGIETETTDVEDNNSDDIETKENVLKRDELKTEKSKVTKIVDGYYSTLKTRYATKSESTLGMSSFNEKDRHAFGTSLRLSMALLQGNIKVTPPPGKALPDDTRTIEQRLKSLNNDITCAQADQLELLVRFDERQGWDQSGAKHCAAWMNIQLGISLQLGWEYLRVGRQLRELPVITTLFRAGQLTWSKVRLLSRVANRENESLLCHAALDASVSQVERLCHEYRWADDGEDGEEARKSENAQALEQWDARALRWDHDTNGNVRISLSLPPDTAQAFLNSVEYALSQLAPSDASMAQRRADAAVLMAENSLQSAGRDIATADRYQVIVSVDAAELRNGSAAVARSTTEDAESSASDSQTTGIQTTDTQSADAQFTDTQSTDTQFKHAQCASNSTKGDRCSIDTRIPTKRASLLGASSGTGTLAKDTARRIACDCSVSTIISNKAEPVDVGQKTRIWPAAMARAIKARDQQCVYPGCNQSQHLQIHHIVHWADGGATCIDNAASLCSFHHTRLHEGGYRIERVENHQQRRNEQFRQQTVRPSDPATDVERLLRNSSESFDVVRQISPERFRFRVIDSKGRDVARRNYSTRVEQSKSHHKSDSTRVEQSKSHHKSDSTRVEQSKSHHESDPTHVEQPESHPESDSTRVEQPESHPEPDSTRVEQSKSHHKSDSTQVEQQTRSEQPELKQLGSSGDKGQAAYNRSKLVRSKLVRSKQSTITPLADDNFISEPVIPYIVAIELTKSMPCQVV